MEKTISQLLGDFDHGKLTRWQLIQALTMLALGGTSAVAAPLPSQNIDHMSVLVSDLARSIDFCQNVFGLSIANRDDANQIVRLSAEGKMIVSLRQEAPPGRIDHFAINVAGTDRESVTRDLRDANLTPQENLEVGFHVTGPDGAVVQISGV